MKRIHWTTYAELMLHVLALIFYFTAINVDWAGEWWVTTAQAGVRPWAALIVLLAFYGNAFVLLPVLLKRRGWFVYGFGLVALVVALEGIRAGMAHSPLSVEGFKSAFFGPGHIGDALQLGLAFSWGYFFLKDWIRSRRQIERLERENVRAELSLLKSQLDPHFLFNTLNGLYGLALEEGSTQAADGIAQLGSLMRYSLEEASEDRISLEQEISFLKRYIALQQLRATEQTRIEAEWPDQSGIEGVYIAPMLLLPLVENAFKYGMSSSFHSFVRFNMECKGATLSFTAVNRLIEQPRPLPSTGTGLVNLAQRLELLYPDRHCLEYGTEDTVFKAQLSIRL